MGNDNWAFFQAFLRSPRSVASVIPSSSFLERRVVRAADAGSARVIVEFGAGTGGITRALLNAMGPESRLLAIERTGEFIEGLERIEDPRLEVVHGCASTIADELVRCGHHAADAVVSGIPFSTMPEALAAQIASAVHGALAPGGRWVAYQFTDRVADYTRPVMGAPRIEHEFRNVPPVRIFSWSKQGAPQVRPYHNGVSLEG